MHRVSVTCKAFIPAFSVMNHLLTRNGSTTHTNKRALASLRSTRRFHIRQLNNSLLEAFSHPLHSLLLKIIQEQCMLCCLRKHLPGTESRLNELKAALWSGFITPSLTSFTSLPHAAEILPWFCSVVFGSSSLWVPEKSSYSTSTPCGPNFSAWERSRWWGLSAPIKKGAAEEVPKLSRLVSPELIIPLPVETSSSLSSDMLCLAAKLPIPALLQKLVDAISASEVWLTGSCWYKVWPAALEESARHFVNT